MQVNTSPLKGDNLSALGEALWIETNLYSSPERAEWERLLADFALSGLGTNMCFCTMGDAHC